MQPFNRSDEPAPTSLSDNRASSAREALRDIFNTDQKRLAQTRISMRSYAVEGEELDAALTRLFRKRCAFCESEVPTRAYRFRPTEEAGPTEAAPAADADRSHLYYSWLINAWQNLYAICDACRPLEASIFPVSGRRCPLPSVEEIMLYVDEPSSEWRGEIAERPILLDPCANEDFRRNLAALPGGELIGLSTRGEQTIRHFNLIRPELVSRRALKFRQYLDRLITDPPKSGTASIFAFANMEFGGGWFLLLYQIAKKLGGGGGMRPTLSRLRIGQYYAERLARPDFAQRVSDAFDDLLDRPDQVSETRVRPAAPLRGEARPVAFTIENFKALEKVEIELKARVLPVEIDPALGATPLPPSAPALVILGENAAGKSSILEAMTLVLSDQASRDDLGQDADRFLLKPDWMGAPGDGAPRKGRVTVRYENGEEAEISIESGFPFVKGAAIPRIPVFAYGAFRLFLKADKRTRASSAIRSLFEANYVLPNPEPWLVSLAGTPWFEEVARALKFILAIDQKVDVLEVDKVRRECALLVSSERPGLPPVLLRTPFIAVSSGFRAILAMVCDIMRGLIAAQDQFSASLAKARAVVLIDEVEAHLHPKWKMRILQGLREALPNVTFIATTHDPLCLRGLAPEEVRVFRRVHRQDDPNNPLPTFVEQLTDLPAMGALTIEQLLTSELFQLHTTDAPAIEQSFAQAGDLLARERAGEALRGPDEAALATMRANLRKQIGGALPIGSTEVERLIQDAVEQFLIDRRKVPQAVLDNLQEQTRRAIIAALDEL
jgi:AAA domain, putative AbiEii toxin, Type IV TA system/AAA domain